MLHQLDLLDSPSEQAFDDFTILASRLLNTPIALVSLVDVPGDRQFFKSQVGLPEPVASLGQTPLSHSFCMYVSRSGKMLSVLDARNDPLFCDNPVIQELGMIAYLGQPLFAPDGTAIGSLCAIDMRPRKWTDTDADTLLRLSRMVSAQIALRHAARTAASEHKFLNDLLETLTVGITALDENGRILFTNSEACAILGVPYEVSGGRAFDDAAWNISASDGSRFPEAELPVARVLAGEARVRDVVHAISTPDGDRRIISVDAARSKRSLDDTAVICSITDVTNRVAAEQKLHDALEASEAASRAKSAFLANMSHEIRTPLNGVLGLAELLLEQELAPDPTRLVTAIHQSGEALLEVVNSVLDLSQIEAGKLALTPRPFDLKEFMTQQHMLHATLALRKGVIFNTPVCEGQCLRVGDDFRIGQIVGNLISNAVKFTVAGSVTLTVSAEDASFVEFAVTDTGIGLTEDQLGRVTREFEQADSSVTRVYGGTGLGLAIVVKLVDLMGGQFRLESALGKGTRASVLLPLPVAQGARAARKGTSHAMPPQVAPGLRILVAEDNATNALILRRVLESFDVRATFVMDGRAACDAWERDRFDALIFDISMPVLDGQGALANIRSRCAAEGAPMPQALAATANVLKDQTQQYIDAGFTAVLSKPFKKEALARFLAGIPKA